MSRLFKIKLLGQAVKTQNTPLGGVPSLTKAHYICLGEKDSIILLVKRPCY
jgi:hypothetical protein